MIVRRSIKVAFLCNVSFLRSLSLYPYPGAYWIKLYRSAEGTKVMGSASPTRGRNHVTIHFIPNSSQEMWPTFRIALLRPCWAASRAYDMAVQSRTSPE